MLKTIVELLAQPGATVAAAIIAAVVAIGNVIVTIKFQKDLKNRELLADEMREGRKALRELYRLAERLLTSVDRLIGISVSADRDKMMIETANTLGIVADFYNMTNEEFRVTAPNPVVVIVDKMRASLAELFLQLEMRPERRQEAAGRLAAPLKTLSAHVAELRVVVTEYVNPRLERIGS